MIHRRQVLIGPLALLAAPPGPHVEIIYDYAELADIKLYYRRVGDGPLMLFLHGLPDDGSLYAAQVREFGPDRLAVAPNLRGAAPSDAPDAVEAYAMPHLLNDIHGLIDFFKRDKAILVGNDFGGYVAWVFAAAYPERVERMVILNAPHPAIFLREVNQNPDQNRASQYERDRRSEPAPYPVWFNYYRADPIEVPETADPQRPVDPDSLLAPFFTGAREPFQATLNVKPRVLVIWGMQDNSLRPGLLDGLWQYADDLTVAQLKDAGHYPMRSHPAKVNQLIRDFLAS